MSCGFADEVIYSLFAKQSEDRDLLHEDLEQIDDVDIEEIDINWQIAMIAIRMKSSIRNKGDSSGWKKHLGHIDGKEEERLTLSIHQKLEAREDQMGMLTIDDGLSWDIPLEHSFETESESLSEPNEMSKSRLEISNEKVVSELLEVEPSCAKHVKTPRATRTDKETQKVKEEMECLSHLIKDCDYYEKKIAKEAEVKRVVNTVQLNAGRPKVNSVRPNINTGRTNINSVKARVNAVRLTVNTARSRQPDSHKTQTGPQATQACTGLGPEEKLISLFQVTGSTEILKDSMGESVTLEVQSIHIYLVVLGKFDGKSDEGFLVGYSLNSKAYRVYNLVTKRVEGNLHVNFLEDKPNVKGVVYTGSDKLDWSFDHDDSPYAELGIFHQVLTQEIFNEGPSYDERHARRTVTVHDNKYGSGRSLLECEGIGTKCLHEQKDERGVVVRLKQMWPRYTQEEGLPRFSSSSCQENLQRSQGQTTTWLLLSLENHPLTEASSIVTMVGPTLNRNPQQVIVNFLDKRLISWPMHNMDVQMHGRRDKGLVFCTSSVLL
ncbi:hypothetical protein Tco_0641657 [Tanacetum coccineum]